MADDSLVGVVFIGAALAALFFSSRARADSRYAGDITTPDDQAAHPEFDPVVTVSFPTQQEVIVNEDGTVIETPTGGDWPFGLSDAGTAALMAREGFSHVPYWDHKGYSIGYGHLIKPGEDLTYVTEDQGIELLDEDVTWAVDAVFDGVEAQLSQNAFDALVSFTYNVGAQAFKNSTLLKKINAYDPSAANEFDRWIYARDANGNLIENAVLRDSRRPGEKAQFLS